MLLFVSQTEPTTIVDDFLASIALARLGLRGRFRRIDRAREVAESRIASVSTLVRSRRDYLRVGGANEFI